MTEHDEPRVCDAEGATVQTISAFGVDAVERALAKVGQTGQEQVVRYLLRQALSDVADGEVQACRFDGTVTVRYVGPEAIWECPVCRAEHREDVD